MKRINELPIVEIEKSINRKRRVVILQRDDGYFCFAEEYYFVSHCDGKVIAEGWNQLSPNGIYQSAEIAEAEGLAQFVHFYPNAQRTKN